MEGVGMYTLISVSAVILGAVIEEFLRRRKRPTLHPEPRLISRPFRDIDTRRLKPVTLDNYRYVGTHIQKGRFYYLPLKVRGYSNALDCDLPLLFIEEDGRLIPTGLTFWNAYVEGPRTIISKALAAQVVIFLLDEDSWVIRIWDSDRTMWREIAGAHESFTLVIEPTSSNAKCKAAYFKFRLGAEQTYDPVKLEGWGFIKNWRKQGT